jgi:hypothetical protein
MTAHAFLTCGHAGRLSTSEIHVKTLFTATFPVRKRRSAVHITHASFGRFVRSTRRQVQGARRGLRKGRM